MTIATALLTLALAGSAHGFRIAYTTPAGELVLTDTDAPGVVLERHAITGLLPGEGIRGIDVRPSSGALYGLGIVPGVQDTGRIYVIDPGTGAATQVGSAPFSTTLTPSEYAFDVNPFNDRIRVINRADQNMRVSADDGTLIANDSPLNPAGDVDAVAYDQNVAGTPQSTLWGYDSGLDRVVRIGGVNGFAATSANNGQVTVLGSPSGISTAGRAGMDIGPGGAALLSAKTAAPASGLYQVNLGSGAVTLLGSFSEVVDDIARLGPSAFAFDGTSLGVGEDAGSATVTILRLGNASGTQSVAYATAPGSAGADDHTPASGTLTFAPGETSKTFAVPIANDGADEPAETVALSLGATSGGALLGAPSSATLTIVDDDPPPPGTAPADVVKPKLLLSTPSPITVRRLARGLAGRFSCSEACSVQLRLKLGAVTLGTRSAALTGSDIGSFKVAISKKRLARVKRRLRRSSSANLRLTGLATDTAGNTRSASATIRVTRR